VNSNPSGGSIIDTFVNNLPVEMHLVDFGTKGLIPYVRRYNFCGPGTKLNKRLDAYDRPVPGSEPINELDAGCMQHDIAYRDAKDTPTRNIADAALLQVANKYAEKPNKTVADRANIGIVRTVMGNKVKHGVGLSRRMPKRNAKKSK
jgi:hypothetical protein